MNVRLLNGGINAGHANVKFPVDVNGIESGYYDGNIICFDVRGSELERVGFTGVDIDVYYGFSLLHGDCQLIEGSENED
tara:strand:- start:7 stop:243 length:237 start_codon:yes stop_codon:yes gene_type:complete